MSPQLIFAVDHDGQRLYPAFQFGDDGQPLSHVRAVLARLPKALTGWPLALWWTTANDRLDGDRPVDRLEWESRVARSDRLGPEAYFVNRGNATRHFSFGCAPPSMLYAGHSMLGEGGICRGVCK